MSPKSCFGYTVAKRNFASMVYDEPGLLQLGEVEIATVYQNHNIAMSVSPTRVGCMKRLKSRLA